MGLAQGPGAQVFCFSFFLHSLTTLVLCRSQEGGKKNGNRQRPVKRKKKNGEIKIMTIMHPFQYFVPRPCYEALPTILVVYNQFTI
jgi:hypothetical protein